MTRHGKHTFDPEAPHRYCRIDEDNIERHDTSRRRRYLKRRAARLARRQTRMSLRQQWLSQTGAMAT